MDSPDKREVCYITRENTLGADKPAWDIMLKPWIHTMLRFWGGGFALKFITADGKESKLDLSWDGFLEGWHWVGNLDEQNTKVDWIVWVNPSADVPVSEEGWDELLDKIVELWSFQKLIQPRLDTAGNGYLAYT